MGGRGSNNMGRLKQSSHQVKAKRMPWETDPLYRNNPNGQLLWLQANPASKYNDPGFISGIKRIESMSDNGVSATARKHFIDPEYLK